MSELAVRLGSPVTFDRTGNVLYYDTFEAGLTNWEDNSTPTEANAVITARYCSISPYCVKLKTTNDANSASGINRGLPYPYASRLGFEFHYKQISTIKRFKAIVYVYTGTTVYYVDLELKQETNQILLMVSPGPSVEIDTYTFVQVLYSPFNVIKIVFDLNTGYYARLVINEKDYNLASYKLHSQPSNVAPYMFVFFYLYSFGTNVQTCYVDNIVLTTDEPQ